MRLTKTDWLKEGLQLLGEQGQTALTIDSLLTRLNVTKGSFYHHFHNYQDYKEGLLNYYEEAGTSQVIRTVEEAPTALARLDSLLNIVVAGWPRLEVAVRAWALQDAEVAIYQARIDARRLAYLEQVIGQLSQDAATAQTIARLFYTVYVGSRQIIPPLEGTDLRYLYREIMQAYHLN